jgi:hypothetical protein
MSTKIDRFSRLLWTAEHVPNRAAPVVARAPRRHPSKQRTDDATKARCDIKLTALLAAIKAACSR